MVTIASKRGTSTIDSEDLVFKKVSSKTPKNETITTNRGTSVINTSDIPAQKKVNLKGQTINTKRGTSSETL